MLSIWGWLLCQGISSFSRFDICNLFVFTTNIMPLQYAEFVVPQETFFFLNYNNVNMFVDVGFFQMKPHKPLKLLATYFNELQTIACFLCSSCRCFLMEFSPLVVCDCGEHYRTSFISHIGFLNVRISKTFCYLCMTLMG